MELEAQGTYKQGYLHPNPIALSYTGCLLSTQYLEGFEKLTSLARERLLS